MTTFLVLVAVALTVAVLIGFPYLLGAGGGVTRGLASGLEVTQAMSRVAMWMTTTQTRPRHRLWPWSPASELGMELARVRWWGLLSRRIFASFESIVAVFGPPGMGKTGLLALITKWFPGPALAVSTSVDLLKLTLSARRKRGPVWVFNPEGLSLDLPAEDLADVQPIRWDITQGCDQPNEAIRRAGGLISGASTGGLKEADWWEGNAHRVLYCLLMASALVGGGSRSVGEWASNLADRAPLDILENHPSAPRGWSAHLLQLHDSEADKTVASIELTLKPVVEFLSDPSLVDSVTPVAGECFDPEWLITSGGSLYLVASDRPHTPLGPLFAALTTHVHETAKRLGASQRLDPPLLETLDEAALICRVPLQRWTSDARKHGITMALGFQNKSQLREVWGPDGADTIWNNATVKVATGAISDKDTLEQMALHGGEARARVNGRIEQRPVLTPDAIRRVPDGHVTVLHRNCRPVQGPASLVWNGPGWVRSLARRCRRTRTTTPPETVASVVDLAAHRTHREDAA